MNKINNRKNSLKAVSIGLFVLLSTVGPIVNVAGAAAAFNGGSQPRPLLSALNGSENGSTDWEESSVNVEVGDGMSFMVYFKNTSSETADDTRVSIDIDIDSNGQGATATAKVWADNAPVKSDSINIDLVGGGEITSIYHTESALHDVNGHISLPGDEDDVVTSSGVEVGDVEVGGIRYFISDFAVSGDDNNNDDDSNNGPEVTTKNAEDIDDDSAELVCDVEAGDEDTDVWFEWGEDDDDLDEDTSKVNVDANDNDTVRKTITGLDEDTKYFFRCVAEDDDGNEDTGSIKNFTTDEDGGGSTNANEPDVTTRSATGVSSTSATLRGEVDPNGDDTDAWFRWGTSSSNLNRTTSQQDVGDGTNDVSYSANISGLSANTTYYFRAIAENGEGDDQGSILNFRTGSPVVNVVTRFIDVFREVEVAPEPEVEALIITLNANVGDINRREIDYTVSYDNRTGLTLTNVILTVPMPNELDFIGSDPRESLNRDAELVFNIGTVRPGEQDSFLIETELASGVDANDEVRFVANVGYNDNSRVRKIVEVIDESTFGKLSSEGGAFTAAIADAFRGLFTNPLLWIILFILLVTFAVRYMLSARDKRVNTLV